jgi:hypothetical protein
MQLHGLYLVTTSPINRESNFGNHGLQKSYYSSQSVKRRSWIADLFKSLTNTSNSNSKNTPEDTDIHASSELAQVDQVKQQIKKFLKDVNFDLSSPFLKDGELKAAVWRYFQSLQLGETEKSVPEALKLAVTFTKRIPHCRSRSGFFVLPNLPTCFWLMTLRKSSWKIFNHSVRSGFQFTFSSILFMGIYAKADLSSFILNKPHNHPLLNGFDRHLRELSLYYGPYCHSTILKSLFDFVNGRTIEDKMEKSNFKLSSDARLMPVLLKTKTGGAEILLHLLWPNTVFPEDKYVMKIFPALQDLIFFTDFTNDILSYHKEFVLRDEKANFVDNFAQSHDMRHLDVLQHLTSYTPKVSQCYEPSSLPKYSDTGSPGIKFGLSNDSG